MMTYCICWNVSRTGLYVAPPNFHLVFLAQKMTPMHGSPPIEMTFLANVVCKYGIAVFLFSGATLI